MNITDAKTIPLYQLVLHLGGRYSHSDRTGRAWYFSPFRPQEKTASFVLNEKTNKWHDFGHVARAASSTNGSGGDILDLWCDYHGRDRSHAVKEALDALKPFAGAASSALHYPRPHPKIKSDMPASGQPRYKLIKQQPRITLHSLQAELTARRITPQVAQKHLAQVTLRDTVYPDKKRTGFGLRNDKGGWEVSIPNPHKGVSFKTCLRPKSPTTYRVPISTKLFVFEGMWDFLSWLEMQATPEPEHNIAILNSLSFCGEVTASIIAAKDQIETVMLFLDNDDAGTQAMHMMLEELGEAGITCRAMNTLYQNYKDLNDYWRLDPAAKRVTEQHQAATRYYTADSAWATATAAAHKGRPRYE